MKSVCKVFKDKSDKLRWLTILAILFVAFNFIGHGIQLVMMVDPYVKIAEYVGLAGIGITLGLLLAGVLDLVVGAFVLVKPNKYILTYALVWPIVPLILEWKVGGEFEIGGKIILWVAVIYVWNRLCHKKKSA